MSSKGVHVPLEVRTLIWRELAGLHRQSRYRTARLLIRSLYSPRKLLRVWYGDNCLPLQPFGFDRSVHFCGLVGQRLPELYDAIFTDENDPGGITFSHSDPNHKGHRTPEQDVMDGISTVFRSGALEQAKTIEMTLDLTAQSR